MPGRGVAPKPPDQVSKTQANKAKNQLRVVVTDTAPAPELPPLLPDGSEWPEQTLKWWGVWSNSPLTADYRAEDWEDLVDCATIHGMFWNGGSLRYAAELRLRMARHGATREDRARLRIVFATAEQAEKKSRTVNTVGTARTRRSGLKG